MSNIEDTVLYSDLDLGAKLHQKLKLFPSKKPFQDSDLQNIIKLYLNIQAFPQKDATSMTTLEL